MQNNSQIRKFIRHPSDVPIQVSLDRATEASELHPCKQLSNVSLGGLAFLSHADLPVGERVCVDFPLLEIPHRFSGEVVWSRKRSDGYEIGICFSDPDELYSLRMVEQACHIEHYRKEVEAVEGRQISTEQAASEWIQRYASKFPAVYS